MYFSQRPIHLITVPLGHLLKDTVRQIISRGSLIEKLGWYISKRKTKAITITNENSCNEKTVFFSVYRNVRMKLCAGGTFVSSIQCNRSYQIVGHYLKKSQKIRLNLIDVDS